MTNTVLR